ncbi:MAG: HEAT repeat domain-containing protein [Myxococcales bacterium]|nr:HEAT repeat domain-containing protein [Myxococcales bacterium]
MHAALAALIASTLYASSAEAQVPRFEQTPDNDLADLRSTRPAKRRAAAARLARYRGNSAARNALSSVLLEDPSNKVRQSAAIALARIGGAQRMLGYAAVCDPDPGTRRGLAAYKRHGRAVRCDRHTHPRGPTVTLPRAEAQLVSYLGHPRSGTRLRALRRLARMNSAMARRYVWAMATKDPYHQCRIDAMNVVAPIYKRKMKPLLRYAITSDPDARVRKAAYKVLAYLHLSRSSILLGQAARNEGDAAMQVAAIEALGKLGNQRAAVALGRLCDDHKNADARAAAVRVLASLKGQRRYAAAVLARVLSKDRSGKVRAAAMRALASRRGRGACAARAQRVNDPDVEVRITVVRQLDGCPGSVARGPLSRAVRDADRRVRKAAVKALVKLGPQRALSTLVSVLSKDSEAAIRWIAFDGLRTINVRKWRDALVDAARTDNDPKLREAAVRMLTGLRTHQAVAALGAVLAKDRQASVRLIAAKTLGRYSEEAAYKALQRAASGDSDARVRKIAQRAAARSPAQRAYVNALLAQTISSSSSTRLRAATQLCALQVPRTYRALVRLLWVDGDASVRTAVARCFGEIDSPLVDVALSVAHGTDSDGGVIRTVEIAQRQRVARLNKHLTELRSTNAAQRVAAVKAMVPSPSRKLRGALEQAMLKDRDPLVRRAAASRIYRFADARAIRKLMLASQNEQHAATRTFVLGLYNDLRRRWASAKRAVTLTTLTRELSSAPLKRQIEAAKTLGALRDRRAFAILHKYARSTDRELRYAAVIALATFGDVQIISKAARDEKDPLLKKRLIQLNYLRRAKPDKIIAALGSSNRDEVLRAVEASTIRQVDKAMPHLAKVALSHLDKHVRRAAARALVLYEKSLAYWTVRVGSSHDASKKLRRALWGLAVLADSAT